MLTLSYIVKRSDFWDVLYCNIIIRDVYCTTLNNRTVEVSIDICKFVIEPEENEFGVIELDLTVIS